VSLIRAKPLLISFATIALASFALFVAQARASSLEEIDAIVSRAPDLKTFLADLELVEKHYRSLQFEDSLLQKFGSRINLSHL
jgi:hypothetical protein